MEKCSQCDHLKKENTQLRKALMDTNKNYVEVLNEKLGLSREIDRLKGIISDMDRLAEIYLSKLSTPMKDNNANRSPWYGMPLCEHGYQCCEWCPAPLVADPAMITYPKIHGAPKSLADSFPERVPLWKRIWNSLKQEKDKWQ